MVGEDAAEYATVEKKDDDGYDDSKEGLLKNAASEQKSEITEDQAARADVIGCTGAESPEHNSANQNDEEGRFEVHLSTSDEDDATKDQKGEGVRD